MLNLAAKFANLCKLQFNFDKSNVVIVGKRTYKDKLWKLGDNYITEVETYTVYILRFMFLLVLRKYSCQ